MRCIVIVVSYTHFSLIASLPLSWKLIHVVPYKKYVWNLNISTGNPIKTAVLVHGRGEVIVFMIVFVGGYWRDITMETAVNVICG